MFTKNESFHLNHALILTVIIAVVLILEHLLHEIIPDEYFRSISIMITALGLHYFLSTSLLHPYEAQDEKIQTLIEETLHELNTPIATIKANLQMLEHPNNDEKTTKRLQRIHQASQNLSHLYENIEHSLKSEMSTVTKESFSLQEQVAKSITKVADIQGNIHIQNNISHAIMIKTEKFGFERSIDNLLSNAIKYNHPDGFVRFTFEENTLLITDSGEGIDSKNLFIIFDKAYQENPTTQGFGLGLSIVKAFCDQEQIRIRINTKKKKGTTIFLDLTSLLHP